MRAWDTRERERDEKGREGSEGAGDTGEDTAVLDANDARLLYSK